MRFLSSKYTAHLFIFVIVAVAIARICSTYCVFCQTYDESAKLARGMEWLLSDQYTYVDHPPFACVFFALGPFIGGAEYATTGDPFQDGNTVLYGQNQYWQMLTLARIGNLLFFVAAIAIVWRWSTDLAGRSASVMAVLCFTTLPTILAHSSIVANDIATAATVGWSTYAYQHWLVRPKASNSIWLGVIIALALLTKFSALVFLPASFACVAGTKWILQDRCVANGVGRRRLAALLLLSTVVTLWVIWSGYAFSVGSVIDTQYDRAERAIDGTMDRLGSWRETFDPLLRAPVPAPEFVQGLFMTIHKEQVGHALYFLGRQRNANGSWCFFPVMLTIKTPLPFMILALFGAIALFQRATTMRNWQMAVPAVVAAAIVAPLLPSDINIGVRHAIPVYLYLSILAGVGCLTLWQAASMQWLARLTSIGLVAALLISGVIAHPDYLAYFNCLASRAPEEIAVDSDLDWGQDLQRLVIECETQSITSLRVAYFGNADVRRHGLPSFTPLQPHEQARGWIAISLTTLKAMDGYAWLEDHEPVALVGRSIRLYYVQ